MLPGSPDTARADAGPAGKGDHCGREARGMTELPGVEGNFGAQFP
jgi:hypothetical protein